MRSTALHAVGDIEAAFSQQILDVPNAQREAAIEPCGLLDDPEQEQMAIFGDRLHRLRLLPKDVDDDLWNKRQPLDTNDN